MPRGDLGGTPLPPRNPNVIPWPKCKCGCGEEVPVHPRPRPARGIQAGDPLVYCPGHIPNKLRANLDTETDPATGCIYYVGRPRDRYRWMWKDGKSNTAHKIAWQEATGAALPRGLCLHHVCEKKGCINPAHLQPMTWGEHSEVHGKLEAALEAKQRKRAA
jgi:hypothetical protein